MSTPFYVLEAELALSTVDGNGDPDDEVWIGACPDKIGMEDPFTETRLEVHGRQHKRAYHEDEEHFVTIANVNAVDDSEEDEGARVPRLERNREYILVIVWFDGDRETWRKRSYFGVTAMGGPSIDDENIRQSIRLRAEYMTDIAGRGDKPDFQPVRTGEVYYVDGGVRRLYYQYDPSFGTFTATSLLDPDNAEIVTSESGELSITIGGAVALAADATGVDVTGEIVATGGSFTDDTPRLEFWVGTSRVASLSIDELAVPDLFEQPTEPDNNGRRMSFANPGWLFSFRSGGYAPEWREAA